MISREVKQLIDDGREGMNAGIPHGHHRITEHIPNIQQGTYYLVGGEPSAGKSAWVDDFFVQRPIEWLMTNESDFKLKIIYYSFEIDKVLKMSKFVARRVYEQTGILTDINMILSRGKNRISDELYRIVIECIKHFERYEEFLTIIDKNVNPTGIQKYLSEYSAQNGKWVEKEHAWDYIPNNKKLFTLVVIDHLNLMKQESGLTEKQNIDRLSRNLIIMRNKCNFSFAPVQQLGRDISNADRARIDRIVPQLADFKQTGNTQEDANIVMALFNPLKYEMRDFYGYDISRLRDRYRSMHLLKIVKIFLAFH